MNVFLKRAAVLALIGLVHWSCCGCEEQPVAPVAVATPTPTPTAAATPAAQGCNLPPPSGTPVCRREPPPRFEAEVVRAQDQVRREHPELFNSAGRVISAINYTGWVATTLRSYGLCAAAVGGDGTDEVGVKNTNDWNEQYDIVTGSNEVWINYTVTCRPPIF